MVGRILTRLKSAGQLRETAIPGVTVLRKPRGYRPTAPGDLVQLDTMDPRPLPGVVLKQFTARDVVSRWDVLAAGTRATAAAATHFLDALVARSPIPSRRSRWMAAASSWPALSRPASCGAIQLFVLPPRSPKLNGCVERANRTHAEEFWECYDGNLEVSAAQAALLAWERRYNTYRPQALGYLTPQQFIQRSAQERSTCH